MNKLRNCLKINQNLLKLINSRSYSIINKPVLNAFKLNKINRINFNLYNAYTFKNNYITEVQVNSVDDTDKATSDTKNIANNETNDLSFEAFNLPNDLLNQLKELGYNKPFPIQQATLRHTLDGK